jgi:hypothetical protein
MKLSLLLSGLAVFALTFTSCDSESSSTKPSTSLEVTVKSSGGTAQSSASVKVMEQGSSVEETSGTTNSSGQATIKLKGDKMYLIQATKGTMSGSTRLTNMLMSGSSYTTSVTIQ